MCCTRTTTNWGRPPPHRGGDFWRLLGPLPHATRPERGWLCRQRAAVAAAGQRQRHDRRPEQVLVEDWCQQYPSHSIGTVAFGADGALYASGGDGASFTFADYGQDGNPLNPCGDPPSGPGGVLTLPPPRAVHYAART